MKTDTILSTLILIMLMTVVPAFSQETGESQAASSAAPAATVAAPAQPSPVVGYQAKSQNIYGEVQTVNVAGSTMTVQYYDYDTDEEKVIELGVAKDAKIENVSGLADIKKGDWVDVTFTQEDGKNATKAITVEKEEVVPTETMPEGEMKE